MDLDTDVRLRLLEALERGLADAERQRWLQLDRTDGWIMKSACLEGTIKAAMAHLRVDLAIRPALKMATPATRTGA